MVNATLLISCADKRGITASVTGFVYSHGGNIISADQHIDSQSNTFFMRIEWSLEKFDLTRNQIKAAFSPIAKKFNMNWQLHFSDNICNAAIFVSKHLHCLYDILYRYKSGQLACRIPVIISNHPDASKIAKDFKIEYIYLPVTSTNKLQQEKKQLKILKQKKIDLVVLARYHQILSSDFIREYEQKIINIHHSFLPAFAGGNPYAQAYQRGVKIIGATSHYVIKQLDQGPIIDQDTVRVSHRDTVEDLKRKGEDLEKIVLSRSIRMYLEHKILCYNNKTVVFN